MLAHVIARKNLIIELQPGNRVRTLVAPNFRWRDGGPLEHLFETRVRDTFFDSEFRAPGEIEQFLYGMLSDEAIEKTSDYMLMLVEQRVKEIKAARKLQAV